MNSYDRAILFSLGYAFRRRFAFVEVPSPYTTSNIAEYDFNAIDRWEGFIGGESPAFRAISKEIENWLKEKDSRVYPTSTEGDFEKKLKETWHKFKEDPRNPAALLDKLAYWITNEGIVELGYAQTVDAIKFILVYLSMEGYEKENILKAVDQAFLAYILPQLEYILPIVRRENILGMETSKDKIIRLKDECLKLGLVRSYKKLEDALKNLENYGITRII